MAGPRFPARPFFGVLLALTAACSAATTPRPSVITEPAGPPPPGSVTLVGAGDIATCGSDADEATARLLDALPDATIFTVGDNAYGEGSAAQFRDCYGPSWGRYKDRTRPAPGNHEYHTPGARGYFEYFGASAGDSTTGYYSYDLGAWHVVVLNSNIPMAAGSPQEQWLRADLAAHPRLCTLAYWHAPRFSSGSHGDAPKTQPLWDALYEADADVVLGGHDHTYERFAPQSPVGAADSARGIREFVVGTGGARHYGVRVRARNSEVFDSTSHGVLKLTLAPTGYYWEFLPADGGMFRDAGSGRCH